ncbi:MAG: hypothetical protein ACLSE8_09055 [Parasutterella sp.]
MRCVIRHLNKYWKKIDWDQIQSGQIDPLPEQFEVVLLAYRPEGSDQLFKTRGYWNETFFNDVTFTLDYQDALLHPVTREVVAWRPIKTLSRRKTWISKLLSPKSFVIIY